MVEAGVLNITHVRLEEQCAVLFTKGVHGLTMRRLMDELGMKDISSPT